MCGYLFNVSLPHRVVSIGRTETLFFFFHTFLSVQPRAQCLSVPSVLVELIIPVIYAYLAALGIKTNAFVFYSVITPHHKLGGLKQEKCILSQFWRSEVWNQGVGRAVLLRRLQGRILARLSAIDGSGNPRSSWAGRCTTAISASIVTWRSPHISICVSSSFYKGTSYTGWRVHSTPIWPHPNLINYTETVIFPNKATFWKFRRDMIWGHNIQPSTTDESPFFPSAIFPMMPLVWPPLLLHWWINLDTHGLP